MGEEKKKEEARMAFMADDIERMLGSESRTIEELSEALNGMCDASQHIAQGEIAYALEVLSDSKRVVCIEADGVRRWRVVTDPVRRRLVMEALCALALDDDPLYIYPAARVVERIVERCQQYDREQVVAELRQLVGMRYLAAGYVLLPDTVDAVLSLGVPAWARMSLGAEPEPAEAPKPAEPVEGAHLAQVHEGQAAMLRAAKAKKKGGKAENALDVARESERGRRIAQRMVKGNRSLAMTLVGHGGLTQDQVRVVRDDYGLHVSWGHGLHVSWGQLVPASASVRNRAALAEMRLLLKKKRGAK